MRALQVAVVLLALTCWLTAHAVTPPDQEPSVQSVSGKAPTLPVGPKSSTRKSSRRISPSILRAYCAILRSTSRMDLWERYCSNTAEVAVLRR